MSNWYTRDKWGLFKFYVFYSCNFTVCKRFILPKVDNGDRCPSCEAVYWYAGPPRYDVEKCTCFVHSCDKYSNILCSCVIESISGQCLLCKVYDKWSIIPPEYFI